MDHGVVHFEIPADDPETLSQFYTQLFGWKIEGMDMGGGNIYYGVSTTESDDQGMPKNPGSINGGMYKRQTPQQQPINYVNVESIEDYVGKAQGLGATVAMAKMPVPGMGYFAILIDPQSNAFGIWQSDPSASM